MGDSMKTKDVALRRMPIELWWAAKEIAAHRQMTMREFIIYLLQVEVELEKEERSE